MRTLRVLVLALAAAALPLRAGAAPSYGINFSPTDTGINAAPLTSSPAFPFRTDGYGTLTLYVQLTRSAATAVNVVCTSGPTLTVQAPLGVATVATGGTISMAPASWTYPVTGSTTLRIIVSPVNDVFTTCTLSGAGATSSDLVSLYARLAGSP